MAIAYRGGYNDGGAANTNGSGLHFSLSGTNAVAGDLAIGIVYSRGATKTVHPATGMTVLKADYDSSDNAPASTWSTTNGGSIFVGYKILEQADIGNTYFGTFTLNSVSNATVGRSVTVFSGVHPLSPVRVFTAPAAGGASNTPDPPALSGGTAEDTVVCYFGKMDDCASSGSTNITQPTNYTLAAASCWQSTGGTDGSGGQAYRLSGTATTENPGTFTTSSGGLSTYWYAGTLALRPDDTTYRSLTGITTGEAFGTTTRSPGAVTRDLTGGGIASDEAYGSPVVVQTAKPQGIATAEAFGNIAKFINVPSVVWWGWGKEFPAAGASSKLFIAAAVSADGSVRLLGTSSQNLYKYSNGSWSEIQYKDGTQYNVLLAAMSADGSTMLIADTARLYKYSSGSWAETRPAGDVTRSWTSLSMSADGSTMLAATYQGGLYKYSSGSWAEVRPAGDVFDPWVSTAMSADGSTMLAGTNGARLWKYSSGSWAETRPAGDASYNWDSAAMSADGSTMFAGNMSRLYKYSSGSWAEVRPAGDVDAQWKGIFMSADGSTVFAAGDASLYKYSNGSWETVQPLGDANENNSWERGALSADGSTVLAPSGLTGGMYIYSQPLFGEVATSQELGSYTVDLDTEHLGIATGEEFGALQVNLTAPVIGIATAEALGTATATRSGPWSGSIVEPGLVAHYRAARAELGISQGDNADATNRGTWTDIAGSNNGTLTGFGWASGSGWDGSGTTSDPYVLAFDADALVTTDADTTQSQPHTWEVWLGAKTVGAGVLEAQYSLFNHGVGSLGAFYTGYTSSRPLLYMGGENYRYWNTPTIDVDDGGMHHWVVTIPGGAQADISSAVLYIDGTVQTVNTTSATLGQSTWSRGFTLGANGGTSSSLVDIAASRVYSRALTPAEVLQNYTAGPNGDCRPVGGGLVAEYVAAKADAYHVFGAQNTDAPNSFVTASRTLLWRRVTLSEAASVESLSLYIGAGNSGTEYLRGVIYADSAGTPAALKGTTEEIAVTNGQATAWRTLRLPSPVVLAAGDYWLGTISGGATWIASRYQVAGGTAWYKSITYEDGAPDPYGAGTSEAFTYGGISATYRPVKTVGSTGTTGGDNVGFANFKLVCKFTLTEAAYISKLTAYSYVGTGTCHGRAIIYSNNSGVSPEKPLDLLYTGDEMTLNAGTWGWRDFTFPSPVYLPPGTYHFGAAFDGASSIFQWRNTAGTTGQSHYVYDTYADGITTPWNTNGDVAEDYAYRLYVSYVVDGSPLSNADTTNRGTWDDLAGSNHGALSGFGWTGLSGWAGSGSESDPYGLEFPDGNTTYVRVEDHASLDMTSQLSMEFWLLHDDATQNQIIMGKSYLDSYYANTSHSGTETQYTLWTANSSTVASMPGGVYHNGDGVVHHVVMTFNSGTTFVYVDNVQRGTNTGRNTPTVTGNPLYIGTGSDQSSQPMGSRFWGRIFAVRLYDRVLTAEEVARNFAAGPQAASKAQRVAVVGLATGEAFGSLKANIAFSVVGIATGEALGSLHLIYSQFAYSLMTVDVTVTTPAGTSATSANDEFTYTAPPAATTPLTVWSTTADGSINSVDASYGTARSAGTLTTGTTASSATMAGQYYSGSTYRCVESFFGFDTSSIEDTATVTTATISLYGQDDLSDTDFTIQARIFDWGTSDLTNDDWRSGNPADANSLDEYTLVASRSSSGWNPTAYNTFTSESAFASNVSLTGITRVVCCSARHVAGTTPSGDERVSCYYADDNTGGGGTDRDPKLYLEYQS